MANGWWVVTYTATGTGAAQIGTVIVQAPSQAAARTAAAGLVQPGYMVGAARGPYPSQAAAASGGIAVSGTKTGNPVTPISGTAAPGTAPPSGNGQVTATPSNLNTQPSLGGSNTCLIGFNTPSVLGLGGSTVCILSKTQARALIAGMVIAGSAVITLVGIALLIVEGFEQTGAGQAAGAALETTGAGLALVPGLEGAGLAVAGAGSVTKRVSKSGAAASVERRRAARSASSTGTGTGTRTTSTSGGKTA